MILTDLANLLREQFPNAEISGSILDLSAGSVSEWDSLGHISLLLSIEDHYGIRFSFEQIGELYTIRSIVLALEDLGLSD